MVGLVYFFAKKSLLYRTIISKIYFWQDRRGREGTIFIPSSLTVQPAQEYSGTYLQFCIWDEYFLFLIAALVITRILLYQIYPLLKIGSRLNVKFAFLVGFMSNFLTFPRDKHCIWTRTDYHPITTKLSNLPSKLASPVLPTFLSKDKGKLVSL